MMASSGYRLTRLCASLVLVLVIGAQESGAFNWTSTLQNGSLINDCTGNTVTFNWNYTLNADEHVLNEEWYFRQKGKADNNLIATMVAGNFLTVGGEPQPQVTQDETGIHLHNVTSAISGVYSMHLNVIGPSGQTVMGYQEVELDVAEGPQTSSGYLNVSLIPEPVFLKESGQYHAQLVCGNFTTMGNPPVSLEWTTPGGHVYPSTLSTANNFTFAIPNPVESGNYTCRLNTSLPSEVCAKAGTLLSESASLLLDGQEIRLQLMEFRMTKLEEELAYLRGLKSDLDHTHIPGKLQGPLSLTVFTPGCCNVVSVFVSSTLISMPCGDALPNRSSRPASSYFLPFRIIKLLTVLPLVLAEYPAHVHDVCKREGVVPAELQLTEHRA